ncbi:type I secretion system permease/ATPase [Rhizobium sp. TH2]|uniref:type I secretion system permease/ATPase n=1 Tax=Rhizobium sp. TH2 TaxID=2775403 RepID=UPI002157906A|nr:type I secretion system permease/ATPase [Rhizobium sp. TH2]UVC08142.1 type I secretion system permease/ATPase [Rhizobium sp. TH2]
MRPEPVALLQSARKMFLRGFIYAGAVSFFLNFSMLIGAIFMIQVYDRVLPAQSYDTLYGLMIIGGLGILIYGLLDFVRNWTYTIMAHGFAQKLNLPALQAGVIRSIEGGVHEGGSVIKDIAELRAFISSHSISVPLDAFWSIVFLAALYLIHPVYAAVAVGFILVMIALNFVTDVLTRPAIRAANEAQARHVQEVANSLRHAEAIEAMGMLPALVRTWRRSQAEMLEFSKTADVRSRVVLAISRSLQKSLQMVIIATGAFLVLNHSVTTSVLFAGMVLTSQAVSPFGHMIESWRHWVEAFHAWGRIKKLIETEGSARQSMPAPVADGDLSVENLVYLPEGRNIPVLRGINFSLSPGEVLGIAGPSGAGKSTLARCLTGIIKPTVGGVFLDGHSTYLWERGSFGKAVGYLPQNLSIIDGTIRQTIARMQDSDPRDVIRAAQAAGIHELIGRLPHGYDTPIAEGMHMLSGGQMQRLALARALYGDPKLIILDEPNSNLDNNGEQALIAAVRQARARGAIIIMIAHRPSVMAVADKMMILEHGAIKQFGPRTEVIEMIEPRSQDRQKRIRAVTGNGAQ